jgi:hypothetical protein
LLPNAGKAKVSPQYFSSCKSVEALPRASAAVAYGPILIFPNPTPTPTKSISF